MISITSWYSVCWYWNVHVVESYHTLHPPTPPSCSLYATFNLTSYNCMNSNNLHDNYYYNCLYTVTFFINQLYVFTIGQVYETCINNATFQPRAMIIKINKNFFEFSITHLWHNAIRQIQSQNKIKAEIKVKRTQKSDSKTIYEVQLEAVQYVTT